MEKSSEKHLDLQISTKHIKSKVQQKFNELRAALHMREKLLLRQLEVIGQQHMLNINATEQCQGEVRFVSDNEAELLSSIRGFGQFQLDNMQLALQDIYLRNEDYIAPSDDHETMYKCLDEDTQPEAIVVDFSRNKSLVEDSAKLMNKSIINITLQEAKDLIRKAKIKRETHAPPLNLEELDDELESSIAEAMSSLGRETSSKSTCVEQQQQTSTATTTTKPKTTRKPRFKPKITINNCNGTINLRNIASLTINCANEETVNAQIPITNHNNKQQQSEQQQQSADSSSSSITTTTSTTTEETSASSSNYSSNASSRSESKKQKNGNKKSQTNTTTTTNTNINNNPKKEQQEPPSSTSLETNSYRYDVVDLDDDSNNDDGVVVAAVAAANERESVHDVTCDFYNRLLNEIKKSLKEKPLRTTYGNHHHNEHHINNNSSSATTTTIAQPDEPIDEVGSSNLTQISSTTAGTSSLSSHIQPGKRLILKNFENLKIILEANSGDEDSFHPVQIEQWLAEIISETDLEPMQNTDILEHSKIN